MRIIQFSIFDPGPYPVACAALAIIGVLTQIFRRIFVSIRAMSFGQLYLCGSLSPWAASYAARQVKFMGDRFKMIGIDAHSMNTRQAARAEVLIAIVASMIHIEVIRNWPLEKFMRYAMGIIEPHRAIAPCGEHSVAGSFVYFSHPEPTSSIGTRRNEVKKTLQFWGSFVWFMLTNSHRDSFQSRVVRAARCVNIAAARIYFIPAMAKAVA